MRTQKFTLSAFVAILMCLQSCRMEDEYPPVAPGKIDMDFYTKAAFANNNEVDLAMVALDKSMNDSVRSFARLMITDHTAAQLSLDSLGSKYGLSIPSGIDSQHAVLKSLLLELTNIDFDSTYVNSQVKDHDEAIKLFQHESLEGNDLLFRNYAGIQLPNLQMHLQKADSLKNHLH